MTANDLFYEAYDRPDVAYGLEPSAELASYLYQVRPTGLALDLGAGAGRDTLALAAAGLQVRAVDRSQRGLSRILERAAERNLGSRIETEAADARDCELPEGAYCVIAATTVLCHMEPADGRRLWQRMVRAVADKGVIYAEVHTAEDPGSDQLPGRDNPNPISETAFAVRHYFAAGELLDWAAQSGSLRVLRYEERLEWDYTHGSEHQHGKAVLLAVPKDFHPPWYGHPAAFPRRSES